MDEIDDRILSILATNGRASFAAIGAEVGLSPHGTADRIRVSRLSSPDLARVACAAIQFEIATLRGFPIVSLQDADAMAQFSEAMGLMGLAAAFTEERTAQAGGAPAASEAGDAAADDDPDNLFAGSLEQRLRKVAAHIRRREARMAELFGGYRAA